MWITSSDIFAINILSRCLGLLFVGATLNFGAMSITQAATNCNAVEENSEVSISKTECESLLLFYHRTGGISWDKKFGWLENNELCSWYGIDCDENGHITKISLSGNNLSGMVPHFDDFPNLKKLDIDNHRLCKHPYMNYGEWQSEVDQFSDCGIVAAFDVSPDQGCIDLNPPSTFEVMLDANPSTNFNGDIDDYYWTVNEYSLPPRDNPIFEGDIENVGEYTISLLVEYGNEGTTSDNTAQRIISVKECLYRLTVKIEGEGSGIVTDGQGLNCSNDSVCRESYSLGDVNLNAHTADDHSVFIGWSDACLAEGTNTLCTITMDQSKSVKATFGLDQHSLHVQVKDGNGSYVVSEPFGINCTSDSNCEESYEHGTEITLTAIPQNNDSFGGWSGSGCYGKSPCVVTMDQAKNVTATFIAPKTLTVKVKDGVGGEVVSEKFGIHCTSDCEKSYEHDTEVILTAIPQEHYNFLGWSGCSKTEEELCTVTMDQEQNVIASFGINQRLLTVHVNDGGGSTVTALPGINCPSDCEESYEYGTEVTLHPNPKNDYIFGGWSDDGCSEKNPCVVTMAQAKNVTATFIPPKTLTVEVKDGVGGIVSSEPAGIDNCIYKCEKSYEHGKEVILTAVPNEERYKFKWEGDCLVTDNKCTVTMDQAQYVTASFFISSVSLKVIKEGEGCTVNAPGISCGTDCDEPYPVGDLVTLNANSDSHHFVVWGEDGKDCSGNSCAVTMEQSKTVTATCRLKDYTLTVNNANIDDIGMGTITDTTDIDDGNNFQCSKRNCSETYSAKEVCLTAKPDANSVFINWNGTNCSGPNNCCFKMDQDKTITANWKKIPPCTYKLTHTTSRNFEAVGGEGNVIVKAESQHAQQCSWEVEEDCEWLETRKEDDALHYPVEGNPNLNSRVCELTIKGDASTEIKFIVTQKGNQLPKAIISQSGRSQENEESLTVTLSGERSFDPEGEITYKWSIPEHPEKTSNSVVMVEFHKTEEIQRHNITLTVTDRFAQSDTDEYDVVVPSIVPAACFAKFYTNISEGISPLTVELNAFESGDITSYEWSASDGQTTFGSNSQLVFEERGTHIITLKTICSSGEEETAQEKVTVLMEPIAQFLAFPGIIKLSEPKSVTLDASDSFDYDGKIIDYQWEVSDDRQLSGKKVNLSFETEGEYEVKLVVVDNDNLSSANLARQTITVVNDVELIPPTAIFKATPLKSDKAPLTVHLDASDSIDPDGTIEQYQWFYSKLLAPDEKIIIPSGEQTKVTFKEGGIYKITLTITDNNSLTNVNVAEKQISVGNWAILEFQDLKEFYKVGDYLEVELVESLKVKSRFHRVDLWVAIQVPVEVLAKLEVPAELGNLFFLPAFNMEPKPFKEDLEREERRHKVLRDIEIPPGIGGTYVFYAAYVEKGTNPVGLLGFTVLRSNLATVKIVISDR